MSDPRRRPDVVIIMTGSGARRRRPTKPTRSRHGGGTRSSVADGSTARGELRPALHGLSWCVPSRPTIFTGQYPDVHGVTQTDGLGKMADDSRLRWLPVGEVPTLGHWFRAAGYDTHYDGKWHIPRGSPRCGR